MSVERYYLPLLVGHWILTSCQPHLGWVTVGSVGPSKPSPELWLTATVSYLVGALSPVNHRRLHQGWLPQSVRATANIILLYKVHTFAAANMHFAAVTLLLWMQKWEAVLQSQINFAAIKLPPVSAATSICSYSYIRVDWRLWQVALAASLHWQMQKAVLLLQSWFCCCKVDCVAVDLVLLLQTASCFCSCQNKLYFNPTSVHLLCVTQSAFSENSPYFQQQLLASLSTIHLNPTSIHLLCVTQPVFSESIPYSSNNYWSLVKGGEGTAVAFWSVNQHRLTLKCCLLPIHFQLYKHNLPMKIVNGKFQLCFSLH